MFDAPESYLRFVLALVFVLGLIGLAAIVARKAGLGYRMPAKGGTRQRRLSIVEVMPLDARRRLVLLRRDETEHLILVGGESDLLLEAGLPAPRTGESSP
jgi:flagellar protein FliO/FliZ